MIKINKLDDDEYTGFEQYEFSPTFTFLLMGATGVGKTSLMASMKTQFDELGLGFRTEDRETADYLNLLHERMLELLSHSEQKKNSLFRGIPKTDSVTNFQFVAALQYPDQNKTKNFNFPVNFIDLPGGFYTDNHQHHDEVKSKICSSHCCLICVDTPALMAGNEICTDFNRQNRITTWFTQNSGSINPGTKVIFVLSRCECYADCMEKVVEKLKDGVYKGLIATLKSRGVSVDITFVHTLGGVAFSGYNQRDNPVFKITGPYKPYNCGTPLILAMEHVTSVLLARLKTKNKGFVQVFKNIFGIDHLDLAQYCLTTFRESLVKAKGNLKENTHYWGISK